MRSQTTMSLKWIARGLEMESWTHVFQSSAPIMHRFVSKVRTDPILSPGTRFSTKIDRAPDRSFLEQIYDVLAVIMPAPRIPPPGVVRDTP
jgi:hypothetical protein